MPRRKPDTKTAPTEDRSKSDRLQVRLDARSKDVLRRAAGYRRKTVSQFVLGSALETAEKVIRDHEFIALSGRDWALFHDALIDPPAPNRALRKAVKRYRKDRG